MDNNSDKWETFLCGKKVYNATDLPDIYKNELILITCGQIDDVRRQLAEYGIKENRILIPDVAVLDTKGGDFEFIWENIDYFSSVYDMLEDNKSKHVLVNILNYKIAHLPKLIKEIADLPSDQYFDKDLITYTGDDIFFNCGAYIGDTIENFVTRNNHRYEKIYCCEADRNNYEKLLKNISRLKLEEVHCFPIGVWSSTGQLKFHSIGAGSGYICEDGDIVIPVDTIDALLKGNKVTFINMDIEGSEYQALLGAYCTIKKWKPILAISVYHKQDDLLKIPFLIKSMDFKYRFFLRHYRKESVLETVLYCIP